MPLITYTPKRFSAASQEIIDQANDILADYAAQGFDLTLRQLYYQFVSRDIIENTEQSYKRLGSIINDARLAGLIDWDMIVDRTRHLRSVPHWPHAQSIVQSAANSMRIDKWQNQATRFEVFVEKDALAGVVQPICTELDVAYFPCRGYSSVTELWNAGRRIRSYMRDNNQNVVVLHLGDHDPSGIDMTRDLEERLRLFIFEGNDDSDGDDRWVYNREFEVRRIALNYDQIEDYNPPPNPAKMSDSRFDNYMAEYGDESWELDALEPRVIANLIRSEVMADRDEDEWQEKVTEENQHRELLALAARHWFGANGTRQFLENLRGK